MPYKLVPVLALALAGCPQPTAPCKADLPAFADADGDGYGTGTPTLVCTLGQGQVDIALDCDDADPAINPDGVEVCDDHDNNCDGQVDEDLKDRKQYWSDLDGDGFGADFESKFACASPGDGWSKNSDDCDDADPALNPDAREVCGGGDEDCDGLADDLDPDVDPSTYQTFYADEDGDGRGDHTTIRSSCSLQFGMSTNDLDCNDANPLVSQYKFYNDVDRDGYGDPNSVVLGCTQPAGTVSNNVDCDDTDPMINIDRNWYVDDDGDGVGGTTVAAFACLAPAGTSPSDKDCDDGDDAINPSATEYCENGVDENCDGADVCDSCLKVLNNAPGSADGVYTLDLPIGSTQAYCDMTTDGGGWTLVSSTLGPPSDFKDSTHYSDLTTMIPTAFHAGVWDGMRDVTGPSSDIRFACRTGGVIAVDLSFYDSGWYDEITASTQERSVCFEEGAGSGYSAPVERKNNLNGDTRAAGDDWDQGFLSGEDACNAADDFTVDFDDGGMVGNQSDGTDWGKANNNNKCGVANVNGAWFIFVRE